jgi:hypothetical protein
MSAAKQRIALVGSAMLWFSGCANQGDGQARSGSSTTGYASEPTPSTTIPWNSNLATPPLLPTSTVITR